MVHCTALITEHETTRKVTVWRYARLNETPTVMVLQ